MKSLGVFLATVVIAATRDWARKWFPCGLLVLCLFFGVMGHAHSDSIYWYDIREGDIRGANLDGTGQITLVSGLTWPSGLALDLAGGQMYWTDSDGGDILRANLDGSGQTILVSGLTNPTGLALDLAGGLMYWGEGSHYDGTTPPAAIWRAKLDGSEQTRLVTGLGGSPRSVVLDLAGGQMYWTNALFGQILRANLDGTGRQTLVSGLDNCRYMALDLPSGKMYWSNSDTNEAAYDIGGDIGRANLDGSGQEIVIGNLPGAVGIALDLAHGQMYWSDHPVGGGAIRRANLDGSGQETLITGLLGMTGIALDLGAPGTAAYFALAAPASVPSGTLFDVTITAPDPYGTTDVNYQGTVTFSTSDTDPGIVLPADYTFTAADAGVHTFPGGVCLVTPGAQTLTATDTASSITGSVTVTVSTPP